MEHLMLDIETWGTAPGSAIRSIGAILFNPETGELGRKFYRNITDESCADLGLTKDPRTEKWWAEQSAEAQAALLEKQVHIIDALTDFKVFWESTGAVYVWGHGASFDPVLVEAAYAAMLDEAPWKFWNIRCCRTVLATANRRILRGDGVHHNALDDAAAQAKAVAAAFRTKQFSPR
jgi:hypothetical protein